MAPGTMAGIVVKRTLWVAVFFMAILPTRAQDDADYELVCDFQDDTDYEEIGDGRCDRDEYNTPLCRYDGGE